MLHSFICSAGNVSSGSDSTLNCCRASCNVYAPALLGANATYLYRETEHEKAVAASLWSTIVLHLGQIKIEGKK